jgi:hypothetical protein
MKFGLFMMPLHDPQRDYTQVLQEDRGAILLAEQLGYEKASRHRPDPPQDQPGGQEELNAGGRRVYKVEMLLLSLLNTTSGSIHDEVRRRIGLAAMLPNR